MAGRIILVILLIIVGKILIQLTVRGRFARLAAFVASVVVMFEADGTQGYRDENADDH